MFVKEDFIKAIDKDLFYHLNKKSLMPFNQKNRVDFLGRTYDKLHKDINKYNPKGPRKYISNPKGTYVARMVPTFHLDDYCIYYYCVKHFENEIAINRTSGTFGNFKIGCEIRKKENEELDLIENPYYFGGYNNYQWKREYTDYKDIIEEYSKVIGNDYQYAISFDIANFYDCIRIDKLLHKINNINKEDEDTDVNNILSKFLKYWRADGIENTVGIPQDEIGDCSRILSCFFLQDYDAEMYNQCGVLGAKYIRYADDQIIFAKSKQDAISLLYCSSELLHKIGLNINTGKVKEFTTYQELDDCHGFSIMSLLKSSNQDVNRAFDIYDRKKNCKYFRKDTILRRFLSSEININELSKQRRIKLLSDLWDDDFLLDAKSHYMNRIHSILDNNTYEQDEFIKTLENINANTRFDSFKLNFDIFKQQLEKRKRKNSD